MALDFKNVSTVVEELLVKKTGRYFLPIGAKLSKKSNEMEIFLVWPYDFGVILRVVLLGLAWVMVILLPIGAFLREEVLFDEEVWFFSKGGSTQGWISQLLQFFFLKVLSRLDEDELMRRKLHYLMRLICYIISTTTQWHLIKLAIISLNTIMLLFISPKTTHAPPNTPITPLLLSIINHFRPGLPIVILPLNIWHYSSTSNRCWFPV